MFALVRGNVVTGFKFFGPFPTSAFASCKAKPGDVIAELCPPKYNPRPDEYESIAQYRVQVAMVSPVYVIAWGDVGDGFKFRGPFQEDDADDEACRMDDLTAALFEMKPSDEA